MPTESQEISRKLDRVLLILDNDERTGTPGLVSRVTDIDRMLIAHIAQYNIDAAVRKRDQRWAAAIFGAIGSGIVIIVKALVSLFT